MQNKWFSDFLPPLEYLKMSATGIDVSDRSIKFVGLYTKKDNVFISKFGSRIIPTGIIESGEIKDKERFIEFLDSLRKELNIKFINVALPEERAFLSKIKLPPIKEDEIRNTIELQLEEHIPLPLDNIIFDFEFLDTDTGNKKNKYKNTFWVNIVAFPKSLIEDYRDVFVKAGFTPLVFEMEAQALARVVVPKGEKGSFLLVDFGATRVTFVIVSNTKIQFTSTIFIGGDKVNEALAKDLNIDTFQSEEIKKARGLVRSKGNEKVFNSLLRIVAAVKEEIDKHIMYWNSRVEPSEDEKMIRKILLCGGCANMIGLPEYLSYEFRLPVERANVWININPLKEHIPEIEYKDSLIYATALGLALRALGCQ